MSPTSEPQAELRLRELSEADAAAVLAHVREIAGLDTVVLTREEFTVTEEDERTFLARYADPEHGFALGAWRGEILVGVLFFDRAKPRRRHHTLGVGMSVRPGCWGQGIGRALLERGLELARTSEGISRVELTVAANNASARALFKSCGFVEEGRKRGAIVLEAGPVDELMMAWRSAESR